MFDVRGMIEMDGSAIGGMDEEGGRFGRNVRVGEEFVVCCTVIFIPGIGSLIEHITHTHTHARTYSQTHTYNTTHISAHLSQSLYTKHKSAKHTKSGLSGCSSSAHISQSNQRKSTTPR